MIKIVLRCNLKVIFSLKSIKIGKYVEPVPFLGNHGSNFGTGSEFGTAEPVLRTGSVIPGKKWGCESDIHLIARL